MHVKRPHWNFAKNLRGKPSANRLALDAAGREAWIVFEGNAERFAKELRGRPGWPTAANAQLDAALKGLKSERSESPRSPHVVKLRFSEGGEVVLLWLPNTHLSSYALHTALRKQISSLFKGASKENADEKSKKLRLGVAGLSASLQEQLLGALGQLALVTPYEPKKFGKRAAKKEGDKNKKDEPLAIEFVHTINPAKAKKALERGMAMGEANNLVRHLAELPPNFLNPTTYKKFVENWAKEKKVAFSYWDRKMLKEKGAGAFLAVASANPDGDDGIAHLQYRPKGAKKKISLVGKGLCFDTGGYNIKPGSYMHTMHRDMTGSAVALALMGLLIELKAPINIDCWLAIAENHVSPTGFKMNEVVIASDGTSIEVVHTDAEGRMVLADTLAFVRQTKPDLCIDFATLTGACPRSLDTRYSGVFSNRARLADVAVKCGQISGERTWTFPMDEDYAEQLKSDYADVLQCLLKNNNADHIYGAQFLAKFIGPETPWVHVDLASEENGGGLGLVASDVTGFGPRWGLHFVEEALKKSWK